VASGDRVRVEVGFRGGQVIGTFVSQESADQLERALHEDGLRVVVLDTEEGPYHVVVPEVAYLRRFNRSSHVGFTAA
jgi:RecB family endonuclease NucS